MSTILMLEEAELRAAVPLSLAAVDVVEDAFRTLAEGSVVMPPILSMAIDDANGEVDVKTAYVKGFDVFAIKVSPGFFDNPRLGIPSLNGLMIALSAKTGLLEAILLDNGYLTNVRTAAAGAVAARWLAPSKVQTVTVLGAGVQARLQAIAAHLVRPYERVMVWSRSLAASQSCADDIAAAIGVEALAVADAQNAVSASHLVITATPATRPILQRGWLQPGTHLTCMGSDQGLKNEIEPAVLADADLYICDRVSQCEVLGELRAARAAGHLHQAKPAELGEIILGSRPGRRDARDVTICDLTGTGVQDTAIAYHALRIARATGVGAVVQR
jgi:ectoine utilization protein EutC